MISIIIPVYNEEACLDDLFARLFVFTQSLGEPWEVIFVDDHSFDNTRKRLEAFCSTYSDYKMIRLSKNSGSHVAIIAGLSHAQGDCAVYLSADLQDPPEMITTMLKEWRKGSHVVWAVRKKREGISSFERISSTLFQIIFDSLSTVKQPPDGSDFALLDRLVIDAVVYSARSNLSLNALIASTGFDSVCVPYTKKGRVKGRSQWTFSKKMKAFFDALTGYSFVPLRMMSMSGTFVLLMGLGYTVCLIARYQFAWEGGSLLLAVVLILSGLQMIMLGLLGEYLWRTFEAAKKTPLFFVQQSIGFNARHGKTKQ